MFVTEVLLLLFISDISFAAKYCNPVDVGVPKLTDNEYKICLQLTRDEHEHIDVICEFKKLTNESTCFFMEFEQIGNLSKEHWLLPTVCCQSSTCKTTVKIGSAKNIREIKCVVRKINGNLFAMKQIDPDSIIEEAANPDLPPYVELIDHSGLLHENMINVSCVSRMADGDDVLHLMQINDRKTVVLKFTFKMELNYIRPMQESDNNTELYCIIRNDNGNIRTISKRKKITMTSDDNDKINEVTAGGKVDEDDKPDKPNQVEFTIEPESELVKIKEIILTDPYVNNIVITKKIEGERINLNCQARNLPSGSNLQWISNVRMVENKNEIFIHIQTSKKNTKMYIEEDTKGQIRINMTMGESDNGTVLYCQAETKNYKENGEISYENHASEKILFIYKSGSVGKKRIEKETENITESSNTLLFVVIGVVAGIIILIISGVMFYNLNKRNINGRTQRQNPDEEIREEFIYSYVSVERMPFYEAKALAVANKKLGDKSFKPSLPDRPNAPTESEYSYAHS